jgi:predicted nucleotide-binding protein
MKKEYKYKWTRFSADVIKEATNNLFEDVDFKDKAPNLNMSVELDDGEWTHDNEEEFLNDYRRSTSHAFYCKVFEGLYISVQSFPTSVNVCIMAPTRSKIQSVFNIFDKYAESSRIAKPEKPAEPPPPKPTIFIGHGRDIQWRDLKDHLHDKHGYDIEAYEIGARAGHAVRDILQDMLTRSSFAILVMTGEDETQDGGLRARQNVIHEIGLFQGRLGFNRAIVVLEKGTEEFSNIQGIEQIRFAKENIKETFGEVLAVLRREFPESIS